MSPSSRQEFRGIGVSAGTSHGPAVLVTPAPGIDESEPASTDPQADGKRVREAMAAVSQSLLDQAEQLEGDAADILQAASDLARDRGLAKAIDKKLAAGSGVTRAVHDAAGDYATMLSSLGGYMAERVTDLYDVRDRTICELRGLPAPGIPRMSEPSILLAHDLSPAQTVTLDPATVLGIVTDIGGPTSHTAILAAQLGIPAVVGTKNITTTPATTTVALDGGTGLVVTSPSVDELADLDERARVRSAALESSAGPGMTADGHPVALLANTGTVEDAASSAENDVEGTGLFRSEFLFLGRESAPTLDEQTQAYAAVLSAFGERRVVVRTLDAGADKPLAFAALGDEENPALGQRGLRLSMANEELLTTQLEALAAAQKQTSGDLWVMAPMVSTVDEARWFAKKARAAGLTTVGVMVEVPAAAVRAEHLLREVDFASIGTNDLAQYTMAADRMNSELADLMSPWQGGVLELIRLTCEGGVATNSHIGVCGEAGGDPLLALVLVGLGVKSLSMAPSKVKAVRASLALHSVSDCQKMAAAALDAPTATDAREAVLSLAHADLAALL